MIQLLEKSQNQFSEESRLEIVRRIATLILARQNNAQATEKPMKVLEKLGKAGSNGKQSAGLSELPTVRWYENLNSYADEDLRVLQFNSKADFGKALEVLDQREYTSIPFDLDGNETMLIPWLPFPFFKG